MSLKVSVSGIRGIWGESLTLEVLEKYTRAFGRFLLANNPSHVTVLVGRDGRKTGEMIAHFVSAVLNSMGIHVLDAGLVPTPSVLLGVREWNLEGGIIITASHNPVEWNALKFVVKGGTFTTESDLEKILGFLEKPSLYAPWHDTGTVKEAQHLVDFHIERILSSVESEAIRSRHFKVILDPVNSAGGPITTKLLEKLGCTVIGINTELSGEFSRVAEPTPTNLAHLSSLVRQHQADVAFAQDPDADRLVIADETGRILSEEWTLGIAVSHVLSRIPGPVVVNLSTSLLSEMIACQYGQACYYTKVGEANVVEGIKKHQAIIGGEGNGGVIYPSVNLGRDSLVGIALTLEAMAHVGEPLSKIVERFPKLFSVKEKFPHLIDPNKLITLFKQEWENAKLNTEDGVRMDLTDEENRLWVHIRASNTEPVMRLIGESTDDGWLAKTVAKIHEIMNQS